MLRSVAMWWAGCALAVVVAAPARAEVVRREKEQRQEQKQEPREEKRERPERQDPPRLPPSAIPPDRGEHGRPAGDGERQGSGEDGKCSGSPDCSERFDQGK